MRGTRASEGSLDRRLLRVDRVRSFEVLHRDRRLPERRGGQSSAEPGKPTPGFAADRLPKALLSNVVAAALESDRSAQSARLRAQRIELRGMGEVGQRRRRIREANVGGQRNLADRQV